GVGGIIEDAEQVSLAAGGLDGGRAEAADGAAGCETAAAGPDERIVDRDWIGTVDVPVHHMKRIDYECLACVEVRIAAVGVAGSDGHRVKIDGRGGGRFEAHGPGAREEVLPVARDISLIGEGHR